MRRVLLIFFAAFIIGCTKKAQVIYYCYENDCISRIDKDGRSDFWYGRIQTDEITDCDFTCEYFGFNNGMQLYLTFDKNKSVKIIPIMGKIILRTNNEVFLEEQNSTRFNKWKDSISGSYKNTILISDVMEYEKSQNKDNNSRVLVEYRQK